MSWREKLLMLRESREREKGLLFVFDVAPEGASEEFLRSLREQAPFVAPEYIEFLRLTDGAQLDYFLIHGSDGSPFGSVRRTNMRWKEVIDATQELVIASDAAGSAFVMRKDGRILQFPNDPPDREQAVFVAPSFDSLLDEVFMGDRYFSLFPFGVSDDNDWVAFLTRQGWIRAT